MKIFVLSILWILTASISFSQTTNNEVSLKPDSVLVDSSGVPTHFAWRVTDQVPYLAEQIIRAEASQQIESAQDSTLATCDTMLVKQSIMIRSYQVQVDNREQKNKNQYLQIQGHVAEEKRLNVIIKMYKIKVIVIPVGTFIFGYCLGKLL